jgi:hypothetical protein
VRRVSREWYNGGTLPLGDDPMKALLFLAAALAALALPGCADTEKRSSAREWQRAECNRIIDKEDRDRCLKRIE